MPPVCPRCGSADSSQVVSAIVAAQTSHATGVTNSVGVAYGRGGAVPVTAAHWTSTTARTGLAGMLHLPNARTSPAMWVWGVVFLVVGVVFGSVLYVASTASTPDPESPIPPHTMAVLVGAIPSAGFWLPGLILIFIGLRRRHRYKREAPLRGRMADLWLQATYCHRDDVVYLPDGTWSFPPAFRSMLRDKAKASRAAA